MPVAEWVAAPVPDAAATVTARIDAKDNFALDDSVTAIARTPRAFRVLLVTAGNRFLEQALRLRTDFQVDVLAPTDYKGSTAYAMTVFDRFSPPAVAHLWERARPSRSTLLDRQFVDRRASRAEAS